MHKFPNDLVQTSLHEVTSQCEARGKRLTPIRAQTLRIMLEAGRGLKAYELLGRMQQTMPQAKPATVYRALDFLSQEGFIHRIDAINGWIACQHIHEAHDHYDLLVICTECGVVKELRAPTISAQLQQLLKGEGYRLKPRETEVRATCAKCEATLNHTSTT